MTKYPGNIDNSESLPRVTDKTYIDPKLFNNLRDAILAIEKELGANPSSLYGTVKARLNYIEQSLNSGTIPTTASQVFYNDSVAPQTGSDNVQGALDALKAGSGGGGGGVLPVVFRYDSSILYSDNTSDGWSRVGGFSFDPSIISDQSNREITFEAVLSVQADGAPGLTAEVRLWDLTNGLEVAGSSLTSTSFIPERVFAILTSYNPSSTIYEVQLRRVGGNSGNRVSCISSGLDVRYSA